MDQEFTNRVELLISSSNDVIIDCLLTRLSFAFTVCRLAAQHTGEERWQQLGVASKIYNHVDEFSHRHRAVLSHEVAGTLDRLRLELENHSFASLPDPAEKPNVFVVHRTSSR